MGASKRAITDPKDQERLLAAADPEAERPALWLMIHAGMHPENLVRLRRTDLKEDHGGWYLEYRRVKNEKPRRESIPSDVAGALARFLERKGRPETRFGYWRMVGRVGKRAGLPGISPMTLRHTACVNYLRQYRSHTDRLKLIARRMGCSEDVVVQNYIDLEEWERTL